MNISRFTLHVLRLLLLVALLAPATAALAQSGDPPRQPTGYDLSWWTVDGGGGMDSAGAGYALGGTVGQADAGLLTGANGYALLGGFWGGAVWQYRVYLPLLLRANP